ncbi:MAG: hypothetical protein ABI880_05895, partial [Acidobacteriota bacterium]
MSVHLGGDGDEPRRLATLTGLSVRNGNHAASALGGGISNNGTLTLSHCVIENNAANYGGGISNFGELTVLGSTIRANTATLWGGGLVLYGTTTIRGCDASRPLGH